MQVQDQREWPVGAGWDVLDVASRFTRRRESERGFAWWRRRFAPGHSHRCGVLPVGGIVDGADRGGEDDHRDQDAW